MNTAILKKTGAISADSHVTEPPNCFVDNIESKYRNIAPYVVYKEGRGDVFVIDGYSTDIPLGLAAAAGRDPVELKNASKRFEELHRGGWDPKARLADQDRDGVVAEMIYPTVGMTLCNHLDLDYKRACFRAYNRWLAEFQGGAPNRLYGLPLTAVGSIDEAIADFKSFKDQGFKGVLMPGAPSTDDDYDSPSFDRLWSVAEELDLPISFHIFAGVRESESLLRMSTYRGPALNKWGAVIRANQDLIGMFIFSGVFERHPKLKLGTSKNPSPIGA